MTTRVCLKYFVNDCRSVYLFITFHMYEMCKRAKVYIFRKFIKFPTSWANTKLAPVAIETDMVAKSNL